jgi:enoyl-CoA hydratase/carnithine racemase
VRSRFNGGGKRGHESRSIAVLGKPEPPANGTAYERGHGVTTKSQTDELLWSLDNGVGVITLNRPDQMNAITPTLEAELHRILKEAETDTDVRAIVLTGSGNAFSAGYDLGEDEPETPDGQIRASDALERWWDIDTKTPDQHLAVMRLAKPVIAAVNGWCLGGGMWYALCSDITIASDRAVFGQPEVREIQNSTFLLAALTGWKHAHRYALTGDHFDAAEAARIGAINEVVPHDQLMDKALALAARIALLPPATVRMNKAVTTYGLEAMGLANAMRAAGLISVVLHASTDSRDLDELNRIRKEDGLRASLQHRDTPFLPEPGGPRSKPRK